MPRLGTWTTIDYPTDKEDEALDFLREKFGEIGGSVRRVSNSHDFGLYPSFEVDVPQHLLNDYGELIDEIDSDEDDLSEEDQKLLEEKDKWVDKANAIETEYSEKFSEWL
jgi:vacuolar-type H+-ATPase subunit I/STV1